MNILVIEDNPSDSLLTTMTLQRGNVANTIITVKNAEDALEVINEQPPLLILLDLSLPTMSGIEFLETIRQTYPLLPVVVMTGHYTDEIYKHGAVYTSKPLTMNKFYRATKQLGMSWTLGTRSLFGNG